MSPRHTNEWLLGIDLGTTVLKMAAFDRRTGDLAAVQSSPLPLESDPTGQREQQPQAVVQAMKTLARAMARQLGSGWANVTGIGLAAQGGSAILADRLSGRALTSMQLWSDSRPFALLGEIAARKPKSYWRRLAMLDSPGAGLARIQWLRQHAPKAFTPQTIYVGAGEFLYFQLTGLWRQDAGNALQIGCYDFRRRRLSAEPLALVGAGLDFVAPMRDGHEMHPLSDGGAKAMGLKAGIPVAGPYMDHEAGYLSAVGLGRKPLQCSLGTAWVGNFVLPTGLPPRGAVNLMLPNPTGEGSLVVRVMRAGNASWDWAASQMTGLAGRKALDRSRRIFRQALLGPPGLVAMPWLTQPSAFGHGGAGAILGLTPHTSGEDILRAVAASMCYEFLAVLEPAITAGCVDCVVLTGGAAQGEYFRRMLTGLFAPLPAYWLEDRYPAGCRGTVFAFAQPVAGRQQAHQVPTPSPAQRRALQEGYQTYRDVLAQLTPALRGKAGFAEDLIERNPK